MGLSLSLSLLTHPCHPLWRSRTFNATYTPLPRVSIVHCQNLTAKSWNPSLLDPPERPSSRPPSATDPQPERLGLNPSNDVLCAAPAPATACPRSRCFSRSVRCGCSPGYPLSVSTHLACRAANSAPLTACLPFVFHNRHFLGHILLPPRCIDCPGESPATLSTIPDPNKWCHSTGIRCDIFPAKFFNQVCYFRNLNRRRYQRDRQRPRQCVRRTADILQLLFMRGARRCALSFAKVQFHR